MATDFTLTNDAPFTPNPVDGNFFTRYLKIGALGTVASTTAVETSSDDAFGLPSSFYQVGRQRAWITEPLNGFTLAGAITVNAYLHESNAKANQQAYVDIYRVAPDGALTLVAGKYRGTEMGTSIAAQTISFLATEIPDTVFDTGDRLMIVPQFGPIGVGLNIYTVTLTWNNNATLTSTARINIAETVTLGPIVKQASFRFRNDNGDETTATWIAAANTAAGTINAGVNFRLRAVVDEQSAAGNPPATVYKLQARYNSGAWQDVNATATICRPSASPNVADGAATTMQIGASGTFTAGSIDEVDGAVASVDLGNDAYTELEWSVALYAAGGVIATSGTVEFRVVQSTGRVLDAYGTLPSLTVGTVSTGPALTPISLSGNLTATPVISAVGQYKKTQAVTLTLTPALARKKFDLEAIALSMSTVVTLIRKKQVTVPAGLTLTTGISMRLTRFLNLPAGVTLNSVLAQKGLYFKTLAASVSLPPAITMRLTRIQALAASLTLASVLNRRTNRPMPVGLVLTPVITFGKFLQKVLPANVTLAPVIARLPLRTQAASLTLTPAISRRVTGLKTLAATVTLTPVITAKRIGILALSATVTLGATMNRRLNRALPLSVTLAPVVSLLKLKLITLPASMTLTATLALKAGVSKLLAASLTLTPAMNRKMLRPLDATVTTSPAIVRKGIYYRTLALTLTLSPNVSTRKTVFLALAATVTNTAQLTMIRILKLQLSGSMPITTVLNRRLNKTLNSSLNLAGVVQADKLVGIRFISLSATANLGIAMVKVLSASRLLAVAVTLDTTLTRLKVAPRLLAAPVSLSAALSRRLNRPLAVTMTTSPVITPQKSKFMTFATNITFTAVLARQKLAARTLPVTMTLTNVIVRLNLKRLDAGLTLDPILKRKYFRTLAVTLLTQPVVDRITSNGIIVLDVVVSMNAKIEKAVKKNLSVALNLSPVIKFNRAIMRFRDWLLSAKMDDPVLDSAELDEPELISATWTDE
jgi:hypothetical protein